MSLGIIHTNKKCDSVNHEYFCVTFIDNISKNNINILEEGFLKFTPMISQKIFKQ